MTVDLDERLPDETLLSIIARNCCHLCDDDRPALLTFLTECRAQLALEAFRVTPAEAVGMSKSQGSHAASAIQRHLSGKRAVR
jgi:hypothetical protein